MSTNSKTFNPGHPPSLIIPKFSIVMINFPVMEPIRHTLTARVGPFKMYREELDQLVALFQTSCKIVTISDNKYRYDSLDDMKRHVETKIGVFDIRGENPAVHFLFNQTEAVSGSNPPTQITFNELRTEEISETAEAVFYKIKDFLVTHQRPRFRTNFIGGAVVAFLGMVWSAVHNSTINATIGSPWRFFASLCAFIAFIILITSVNNYLTLETKRNSASFFVRYREEFAKSAVTSLISALTGGVIGYLLGHFLK